MSDSGVFGQTGGWGSARDPEGVSPIIALSNIIIDDIVLADGTQRPAMLGGAAVYAALGAAQWWRRVGIVAGIGQDFADGPGTALTGLGLLPDGLLVRDPHTIRSTLVYRPDGERSETPVHGEAHFAAMELTPEDVPTSLLPAAGAYLFRGTAPEQWRGFDKRRDLLGPILWELQGDAAEAALWPAIRQRLAGIDIVSLNAAEAGRLLGDTSPDAVLDALLAAGCGIAVLRLGAEGALVGDTGRRLRVRPPPSPVIDVTGGGNSFCGGFLAGWCGSGDLEFAARAAAASAAHALAQFGPPTEIAPDRARQLAAATLIEWRG
jgi:sugar/nucleoside kinase (ribokinase family)